MRVIATQPASWKSSVHTSCVAGVHCCVLFLSWHVCILCRHKTIVKAQQHERLDCGIACWALTEFSFCPSENNRYVQRNCFFLQYSSYALKCVASLLLRSLYEDVFICDFYGVHSPLLVPAFHLAFLQLPWIESKRGTSCKPCRVTVLLFMSLLFVKLTLSCGVLLNVTPAVQDFE